MQTAKQNDFNIEKVAAPFYWLYSTLFDWCILFCSFACMYFVTIYSFEQRTLFWYIVSSVVCVLSWIIFGARQHALAIMAHDGAHGLICRNRTLNDFLTKVFTMLPFGLSLDHFRDFHFSHHKNLGTVFDPELFLKKGTRGSYDLPNRGTLTVISQALLSLFGFSLPEIVAIIRHSGTPRIRKEYFEVMIFYSALFLIILYTKSLFIILFVLFWFFCLCTSFFMFFKLRIFTEHVGTIEAHHIEKSWLTSFFICPHNTWCHYEHHALPSVTSRDLPKFRKTFFKNNTTITVSQLYKSYMMYPHIKSGSPLVEKE
jgi:fatty acid desaturase